ncbi:MAG TPA: ABC transporter permease [Chloroflexota bacterium]|nr:ABC transporter permease [Chloroflexota bacterium]
MTAELVAIWAIVRKDVAVWARQPTAIAATLLPAISLMVVLYIGASAVGRNPVALVVEDDSTHAQQLAAILKDSDAFNVTQLSADQAAVALQSLQVAGVITIPPTFDTAFDARQPDPVKIEINNLNLDFTNDLRRSLPAAITDFYSQLPDQVDPIGVQVEESDLRLQDISLLQFQLIPNLVLLLTIAGAINAGLATAREWEDQTIKELLLAPIQRESVIIGKLLAGWLTTLVIAAVVLAIGAISGYLRPQGGAWVPTLVTVLLLALTSAAFGVAIGAMARRFQRVAALTIPLSFYLFFLSGGISVIAFLPEWVQTMAQFVPTYYGMHALQMAVFYNSSEELGRDLAVLVATAGVMLALAVASLRRQLTA